MEPGSNVTVSVVRARRAEPQKLTVTRDVVAIPTATEKLMEDGVGYIRPDTFTRASRSKIANRIKSLQKQARRNSCSILRNNGEGDELEGIAAANLLNHGTITYLQGQGIRAKSSTADPAKAITSLPVAAGESWNGRKWSAAAILEMRAATWSGRQDFRRRLGAEAGIDLPDGSALILSVAKYYFAG